MKRTITHPQTCDMGSGFGIIEFEPNATLGDILKFYKQNVKTWGTCTIKYADGKILRKFDFDLYNNRTFYYHLSWELDIKVKEVKFDYCFMSENLTIILDK